MESHSLQRRQRTLRALYVSHFEDQNVLDGLAIDFLQISSMSDPVNK
jgi:hypothetical protein